MKKRRSTVYVRPGKDVTLYVPADTPPEVIDYLNYLKAEGNFSQGVIDIVARYVAQRPAAASARTVTLPPPDRLVEPCLNPDASLVEPAEEAYVQHLPPKQFDLSQIFRQAQRNAGKLTNTGEDD